MQNYRAFALGIGLAMGVGTVAGAVIGTLSDNLAIWIGVGPAIGLAFAVGPVVAFAQRKQKDPSA